MKKRVVTVVLLTFLSVPLFSQVKDIEVRIGSIIWTGNPKGSMSVIKIETGTDGIIDSIKESLPSGDVDFVAIKRTNNGTIVITGPSDTSCTIEVDRSTLLLSGPYLVTTGQTDPLKVVVSPAQGVIYDSRVSELKQVDKATLVERLKDVPNTNFGYRLYGNTLFVDFRDSNNVNYKYKFVEGRDLMYATYFYHMGLGLSDDDFDEYSPPIEIRGPRLFSSDTTVNVINHFILVATESILSAVLFPSNFLPSPPKSDVSKARGPK